MVFRRSDGSRWLHALFFTHFNYPYHTGSEMMKYLAAYVTSESGRQMF